MSESADHPVAIADKGPHGEQPAPAVPWGATWVVMVSAAAVVASILVMSAGGGRGFFLPVLAGVVCGAAALFDGWRGRIPNALTYTAMLIGLGLNSLVPLFERLHAGAAVTWVAGPGAGASWLGFGVCAGLTLMAPLFGGGLHGGDLKLLAALGAMLGLVATGNALIVALAVAVVYALINLAVRGKLNGVVRIAAARMMELVYLRRFETQVPEEKSDGAGQIPMAVPLAVGVIFTLVWQWRTGGGVL